jgi:hypothetical protein
MYTKKTKNKIGVQMINYHVTDSFSKRHNATNNTELS